MLGKVNAMAVAAVLAAGAGGALTAQPAQAQPGVAVPCSTGALASAVASAANDTTLSLAAGCVYNLTAALPEVSQALTITGNSATLQRSYAAGTAAFTILTVTGSGILTVNGLNFRHGAGAIAVVDLGQLTVNGGTFTANAAANGGAIYSDTVIYAPQITGAMFTRNTATGSGGAIYNFSAGASISVSGSVFTENNAANGGAIWEYGIGGSINSSTFRNNSAGTGGALLVSENSGEAFNDVVIRGNSASGDGGGIYVAGGGVGGAFLDDSTVSDNHAGGQGGGLFDGGGETSQVIGSHILGNSAAYGAGIYNDSNAIFRLTGSTVSGNRAATDGGGIYNATEGSAFLTTSTVSGNGAVADGGGIYNASVVFNSLTNSTLSGNQAAGYGGGVYNQEGSQLTAAGTHIVLNTAPGGGGGIYDDGPYITVTLTHSPVTGNEPDNCEPPGSITGCTA